MTPDGSREDTAQRDGYGQHMACVEDSTQPDGDAENRVSGAKSSLPPSHHRIGHLGASRQDWRTPRWLFDQLNAEFRFTLDAAASAENALCAVYYTEEDNALIQAWTGHVFANPPYKKLWPWVFKARCSALVNGATAVLLLPASTDTAWFHGIVQPAIDEGRGEVRFLRGRLRFEGAQHPATFASMIVIFRPWKVQR